MKIIIQAKTYEDWFDIYKHFEVGNSYNTTDEYAVQPASFNAKPTGMLSKACGRHAISMADITVETSLKLMGERKIVINYSGDNLWKFSQLSSTLTEGVLLGENILDKLKSMTLEFS